MAGNTSVNAVGKQLSDCKEDVVEGNTPSEQGSNEI
jgi:hypothetical protein